MRAPRPVLIRPREIMMEMPISQISELDMAESASRIRSAGVDGFLVSGLTAGLAAAADAAGEALAKKEACLKCHGIDKKKEASSLKSIAKKYAGKPDGEAKILAQITTAVKVKMEDGTEEEHKTMKTKDQAAISNMIKWILSLK